MIRLPPKSPNLNAYAERFLRSSKDEFLNRMIFIGEAALRRAPRYLVCRGGRTARPMARVGRRPLGPRCPRGPFPRRGSARRDGRGPCRASLGDYSFAPLGKSGRCGPHHAKALAGRRFHDPPALDEAIALRAELLEARDFGVEVVGLDVDVHAGLDDPPVAPPSRPRREASRARGSSRRPDPSACVQGG